MQMSPEVHRSKTKRRHGDQDDDDEGVTQYAAIDHLATERVGKAAHEPVYSSMASREPTYRNVDANGMPIGAAGEG